MKKLSLKISEASIQSSILEYLKIRGIFAWKASSTGVYDPRRGIFRTNPHAIGVADIIGIVPENRISPITRELYLANTGRFLAIEVKSATGKLSLSQESFRAAVISNGGLYCLARSVDDVIKALEGK